MAGMNLGIGLSLGCRVNSGTPPPGYNAVSTAYFAAMTTQPDATRKGLIDALISGLVADGVWAQLDWFVLMAAQSEQEGRLNAVNPAKALTAVNSPTFTTDRGYSGDGATSYLDFNELGNAAGNLLSLNSATAGAWCNAQGTTGVKPHFGQTSTSYRLAVVARDTAGSETFRANDATDSASRASTLTRLGHRTAVRQDSATKLAYFNGANTASLAVASTAVASSNNCALRMGASYSDDRLAAIYAGAALSASQITAIHSRLSTYLTVIGAA